MIIEIIFELVIAVLACIGLVMHSGLFGDKLRRQMFVYYTNLSNLLVALFFIARAICFFCGLRQGWFYNILFSQVSQYSVMMSIFLTFAIFHFVLVPDIKRQQANNPEYGYFDQIDNKIVHYIVPLTTLLSWLFLAEKDQLDWTCALRWTVVPLIYLIFAWVRGHFCGDIEETDSPYPYGFMDPDLNGWKRAILNSLLVFVIFIVIGLIWYFVGRLIPVLI